jgi:HrpA-like RNA helicase
MTILKLSPTGILDPCGKYPNPFTKKKWDDYYYEYTNKCTKDPFWFDFPTWEDRGEIFRKIHEYQIILVTAGTGTGKTFIVPKLFSHYFNYEKSIIMTVPKKTLVEEGAKQVSLFLGVPYKKKIWSTEDGKGKAIDDPRDIETGYKYIGIKHSGEKRFDDTTKILFSTDGSLAVTVCKTDPMLAGFHGLMIDEAHERNISIDILLAMCVKICRARPDFKVMIMSATISREMVKDYFIKQGLGKKYTLYNTEQLQIYDKETIFLTKSNVKIADLTNDMMKKIDDLLLNKDGRLDKVFSDDNYAIINGEKKEKYTKYGRDILGFVATNSKINAVIKYLESQRDKGLYKYKPAFFKLTAQSNEETKSMAYDGNGLDVYNKLNNDNAVIKVMICTNVAESSVTFKDPLGFVFDTGTIFQVGYDPKKYGIYQREAFTAKANIAQRTGRTGRNCFGRYYPSYSENQWNNEIVDYEPAPVTKTDLTDTCLNLCLMPDVKNMLGCIDFFNGMLEPISRIQDNLRVAFNNLHDYDMMYKGEITPLGKICSKFGEFNYQIVRMILCAFHLDGILVPILKLACLLTHCRSYDDLFDLPVGKTLQEMPKSVQDNIMSIKKEYTYPAGEHLSMLFLYDAWLSLPEYQRPYLEKYYKLRTSKFVDIETSYKMLAETVFNNLDEIKKLKLFKKYKIHQTGGSYDTFSDITLENLMNTKNTDYGFNSQLFNQETKSDFTKYGFKLGCEDSFFSRIESLNFIHNNRGNNNMSFIHGGGKNKNKGRHRKNKNKGGKNGKDGKDDKAKEGNGYKAKDGNGYKAKEDKDDKAKDGNGYKAKEDKDDKAKDGNGYKAKDGKDDKAKEDKDDKAKDGNGYKAKEDKGKGGKDGKGKDGKGGKGYKKISPEEKKKMMEEESKRNIMIEKMKSFLVSKEFSMRGLFAKCPDNLIDIGDINEMSIDEKVQFALYFGFCNQIAMKISSPNSKKYVVKYSDELANIKKSMLVLLLDKTPDFVLYHSFMLSDEFDNSLSIVSHLTFPVITRIMNAKKKLLDMNLL